MVYSEDRFENRTEQPLYVRAIQGHSGGAISPNFFTHNVLPTNCAKLFYHIGYTKFEDSIKTCGLAFDDSTTKEEDRPFVDPILDAKLMNVQAFGR